MGVDCELFDDYFESLGEFRLGYDIQFDLFFIDNCPLHFEQISIDFILQFGQTVCVSLAGIDSESISPKFEDYPGIGRRMQYLLLRQNLIELGVAAAYFEVDILLRHITKH